MDDVERDRFLAAAAIASELVRRREVADRWADESACQGMTVGGLACHLASQVVNAVRLLEAPEADSPPITVWDHYRRAAWVNDDPGTGANAGIRDASDEQAAELGADGLGPWLDEVAARLPEVLTATPADRAVLIPWSGWALSASDILLTRTMEIAVHSDDLAASIGVPTPELPDDVMAPVLALLTGLASRRHGPTALVRALTRPQRAPHTVAAF